MQVGRIITGELFLATEGRISRYEKLNTKMGVLDGPGSAPDYLCDLEFRA